MTRPQPVLIAVALIAAALPMAALQQAGPALRIAVEPGELTLEVGSTATLRASVRGADGQAVEMPVVFFSSARRSLRVDPATGQVQALRPGRYVVTVRAPAGPDRPAPADVTVPVHVPYPPVAAVEFDGPPTRAYRGTRFRPDIRIVGRDGNPRTDIAAAVSSSDPLVADVTPLGFVRFVGTGTVTLTATAEGVSTAATLTVVANPARSVRIEPSATSARTGDVVHLTATALDQSGAPIPDMPIEFAFRARTVDHDLGSASSGLVTDDGRFVADLPGEYTIVAAAGDVVAVESLTIVPRAIRKMVEVVGRGRVADRKTSDLWVWTAPDGRDYAVTGTWGSDGHALFWDVTDPANITQVAAVQVDARTVNDVKVSEDGSVCAISREGASNRRNGLVLLDCSNIAAAGVPVLASFDDELTGGVHNVFIADDHVYALSAGRRYDVINIEDPRAPRRVGRFELDTPDHSIHDVWVVDGIAVSSNWTDGVVLADVGGGGRGGSPSNPVKMGQYAYPSGWNHAAWPYRSPSTGKFYVFAGDEHFPIDRNPQGIDRFKGPAVAAAGWIHVIDFDDPANPREVARYEVPEGGTHNFWIENDVLYVAYYNQGLRVVDISGELLGNLYTQGREIAYFLPDDPEGFKPNAARTWGAMPFKGLIYLADNNSGLWAVRLKDIPARLP